MSGHSKWATIKRQKAINDKSRGQAFSKLSRAITIAAKTGGGPSPDSNYKLRVAIDAARAENMPKDTIDRAINKATSGMEQMEEVRYEGFGPKGVAVIIDVATDNRNRTAQEIKSILDRAGGSMGQPGAVAFNFDSKGYLSIQKAPDADLQTLELIDIGVDEIEPIEDSLDVYVSPQELFVFKKKIEDAGFVVNTAELVQKPKVQVPISDEPTAKKLFSMLEALDELEDVQRVFENSSVSVEILKKFQ